MVDMAHDGDNRRTRLLHLVDIRLTNKAFLDVRFSNALDRVTEFLSDQLGRVAVDHVGDLQHDTLLHQDLHHIDRTLRHAVCQFLNGDDFRDHDFADNLLRGILDAHMLLALALDAAAHRGQRALAIAFIIESLGDGQLAAPALFGAARNRRLRRRMAGTALRLVVILGFVALQVLRRGAAGRRIRVEAALCFLGGAGTRRLFGRKPGRFLGRTCGGLGTLAFATRVFVGKAACFLFGAAAILAFALAGAVERQRTGLLFFLGQRAQHDARPGAACGLFLRGRRRGRGGLCRFFSLGLDGGRRRLLGRFRDRRGGLLRL